MWESVARFCSRYAVLVVGAWIALAIAGNVFIPQIERVVRDHARAFLPADSPSSQAVQRMGALFDEPGSNNLAYVVLESEDQLGAPERAYYDRLVPRLTEDTTHVQWVMDLWSKPLSASVSESSDHKAAYVQLRLAGQLGTTESGNSVDEVRRIAADLDPPPGLQVFVTGPGPTVADELTTIDRQLIILIVSTALVIAVLMYLVYRSAVTSRIPLLPVAIALAVARPVVAVLGQHDLVEVSIFSANLLASMTLGAVTNYGIFMIGRYHELRRAGVESDVAVIRAYRSVAPVVSASALTIVVALCSLNFAKVGVLRSAGLPCAISIVIGTLAALTLLPALIGMAGRRGMAEPRPQSTRRQWRHLGVMVARWPGPMLVAGAGVLLLCALPVLSMHISFDESKAQPDSTESNRGYQAMDRHFPPNRLLPEIVVIESDHDLRTPTGLIALEHLTAKIMEIRQVQMVQSATRPAGTRLDESALTSQAGQIGERIQKGIDSAGAQSGPTQDLTSSIDQIAASISQLRKGISGGVTGLQQVRGGAASLTSAAAEANQLTSTLSGYLDPARSFVATNPNCAGEPGCRLLQQIIDPVDQVVSTAGLLSNGVGKLNSGMDSATNALAGGSNSLASVDSVIARARTSIDELSGTMDRLKTQVSELTDYLTGMGRDFTGSGAGGFYMPQRALDDPRYREVSRYFFSPNGHATRLLVYGDGAMFGEDGAHLSAEIADAIRAATKEGSLSTSTAMSTGVGPVVADLQTSARHDSRILMATSLVLVFLVVLAMLRAPVAAAVVVATVVLSYGAALGLGVLFWQHVLDRELHWAVPTISFIALVAVGADYNLLMTARLKEERTRAAGLRTALIRTFDGTGGVVTAAGIVFGLTMFALLRVNILSIAQVGSTVGVGLLLDTLIVRTLIVPSIAVLLGRWFWWPFRIFDRAARPTTTTAAR